MRLTLLLLISSVVISHWSFAAAPPRPNILWITIEDWSADLSCYGTKGIHTPHVDQLASEGIRYTNAFTTSPVCSTSRSAMMTGFHQNYIGGHQHREANKQPLPHGIRPLPNLVAEAGYFTCLMSKKTDLNFLPDTADEIFLGKDWSERAPGQPFFARITFGGTHRSWERDPIRPIDTADIELPLYYPDTEYVRRDWANGLEQMQLVDREVGAILQRLEDEGIADNTLVFFIGDHGRCHIRGKQFLYDGGIGIPMIMRWPGRVEAGQVSDAMVMSLDICATILEATGATSPIPLHGSSLFSSTVAERPYIFAARDKMGDTHDAMRAVRSRDFKLIHNLMPERAWCQYSSYKEGAYPMLAELNILHLEGKLTPAQANFMASSKPEYELFDLRNDPDEVINLAADPAFTAIKKKLLQELNQWRKETIEDQGITDTFRAQNVFPDSCPTPTVAEWIKNNGDHYDFKTHGFPSWYPTRTLEEWKKVKAIWEPFIFRSPEAKAKRPKI